MDPARWEEAGSAHVDWNSAVHDANKSEAHPNINKASKTRANQQIELESIAGSDNSNPYGGQAFESMHNSRKASYEPIPVAKSPYHLSIMRTNHPDLAIELSEFNIPESGHPSSLPHMDPTGPQSTLYVAQLDDIGFETSFQEAYSMNSASKPRMASHPLGMVPGSSYDPQQSIHMGKLDAGWYENLPTPSSQNRHPIQEGYGASGGNNSREKNHERSSGWSPNKFASSIHPFEAHNYPREWKVARHGFTHGNEPQSLPLLMSRDLQGLSVPAESSRSTTLSAFARPEEGNPSFLKPGMKRKPISLDAEESPERQRLDPSPTAAMAAQSIGAGITGGKNTWDSVLEGEVKDNEKLYKGILWTNHCQRLGIILESANQKDIDLASGAGIMVRCDEAIEKAERWIFENSPVAEARSEESRTEKPLLAPGVRAYLERPLLSPKRIKLDSNTRTQLNTPQISRLTPPYRSGPSLNHVTQHLAELAYDDPMDCESDGENELAPVTDIEFRKPSTVGLALPAAAKARLAAAEARGNRFTAAKFLASSTQTSPHLSKAKEQSSAPAVRTPRKRKVLEAQDPGPRNFLEHEFRLLHELHHQLKPGESNPSDRQGWSDFLLENGPTWRTFLSRNEAPQETVARHKAIAEHKAAVEYFEKGEKARGRQAHRERQHAATAASKAKLDAMTEKNLQKRAENPDVPWRNLRQA
ncbi:uncharacterized protein PAC_03900 [Phialocephala subalpina]|uniref:Uncharacterized protein n=1 Tax=Phialocephala subalpina TaxID=576137 RepID=A0A1L7WML0_9HELO|nr:uncharacterized protein PAC_03900 [Phialocephala subalpina]